MLTPSPTAPAGQQMPPGAKTLQEKIHLLLSKLSSTIEIIKTWPESEGDDASIHVATTTKLISSLLEVISGLKNVEGVVKADSDLRKALHTCPVSINLLDLLDHGGGLNPDCFSRGLLRESLGQLKGLRRRKLALKMLGEAVNSGLGAEESGKDDTTNKRKLEDTEVKEEESLEPSSKKARTQEGTEAATVS